MDKKYHEDYGRSCRFSIPLLLRLFEYIHEHKNLTDDDLHFMAERSAEMCETGVRLTMDHFESIVPKEQMVSKAKLKLKATTEE